jgi:uncharacterized protein YcnI
MRLLALVGLVFFAAASAASAHVTVIPSAARPGETRVLTFRVVNERSDAATVAVELFMPAGIAAQPADLRGWTRAESGSRVTWTANGASDAISGERSRDFEVKAGPLPDRRQLVFKVLQHYSSGEVVRWIQDPSPDADRPAPVLQLTSTGRPQSSGGSSSAAGWAVLALVAVVAIGGAALILRRRSLRH